MTGIAYPTQCPGCGRYFMVWPWTDRCPKCRTVHV